ncbi:MAG: STAS domain-containing protein [Pseudomonadota bacterium]|nr:STAS domain-containing protein [Pseudomonadota bacterium]
MDNTKPSEKRKPPQRAGARPPTAATKSRRAEKAALTTHTDPRSHAYPAGVERAAASVVPMVQLGPSLQIKDVEDAHRILAAGLAADAAITVDIGQVGAVDTAGVQLLVAFQRDAARRGVSVQFRGTSAALTHAMTVLGLGAAIHIPYAHD